MAANDMDAGCFAGMGLKDAEIKSIVSAGDTEMQIRELRLCRLRLLDEVHIGMAVDTDRGLLVPVIRNADSLGVVGIAKALRDLVARAREGKMKPDDVEGGTFTVSNLGAFDVDHFIAISDEVRRRIAKVYRREATIIYPPVDVGRFAPSNRVDDYYLFVGRLVPYRRLDVLIEAFNQMGKPLKIAGSGRDRERLEALAAARQGRRHLDAAARIQDGEALVSAAFDEVIDRTHDFAPMVTELEG